MELDFTTDIIEHLVLKKSLTNKKYLNVFSKYYDDRWFENKKISSIIKLLIGYIKKYDDIPPHKTLSSMINKYAEKYQISASELNSELTESKNLDIDVESEIAKDNISRYFKEKGCYFTIVDTSNDILHHGNIDKCIHRLEEIISMSFEDKNIGMMYFKKEDMDTHWDYLTNPESKISTGWKSLDLRTNNGVPKDGRFLGLFLAQSGLGKSLFLSNMVVNFLKQNLCVAVISLEMSENVYAQRFDAHISHDNINKLKHTNKISRSKIEKFYDEHPNANLIIKEYPPNSVSALDIDAYLEELKENGIKLDVLVIDYLGLMKSNTKQDGMYQEGKKVSEEVRQLSYKWNIPIMSAVQSNSEGMGNSHIDMEHVSQSRGIVHTADFIAALYQTDDDRSKGITNMRLIKNRLGGEIGKVIPFSVNPENLVVTDRTFENEETEDDISESDMISENLADISSDMEIDL